MLAYLRAALDLADGRGGVFEIGGPEWCRGDMMREYAAFVGCGFFVSVPVLTRDCRSVARPRHAGPGARRTRSSRACAIHCGAFAGSARDVRNQPMPLRDAFRRAIDENAAAQYKIDTRAVTVDAPPASVCAHPTDWRRRLVLCRRVVAAAGLARPMDGRCWHATTPADPDDCVVGDVIDGWRVEAYEPDRLLRSRPG